MISDARSTILGAMDIGTSRASLRVLTVQRVGETPAAPHAAVMYGPEPVGTLFLVLTELPAT
jgi:hypothetical protein